MYLAFHQAVPTLLEAGGGVAIIAVVVAIIASIFSKN